MKPIDILEPKTSTYWCDGTGRDSYIATNNGGFSQKRQRPALIVRSSSIDSKKACSIIPKQVHYFSNGTGRDQHILSTEGGFSQLYQPQKTFFCSALRAYPRMPSLPTIDQRDYFIECQHRRPPQEQIKQKLLQKTMSIPKLDYQELFQLDPFLKQVYQDLQGKKSNIHGKEMAQVYTKKQKIVAPLQKKKFRHSLQQLIQQN